jgi:hypothetical protein
MHKSIFYLRLSLPGISNGKTMDIADWLHGLVYPVRAKVRCTT